MGTKYDQLSLEDRCEIARLRAEGRSIRQIAAAVDRAASSISRELKRNRGEQIGYKPAHAQERTKARRWKGSKLDRNAGLREEALAGLRRGWSPEQVCADLERRKGRRVLGPETIYRFIAAQIARHKDYSWRHYLPRAKARRGWRGRKGGSSAVACPSPRGRPRSRIVPFPAIGKPI
jgi:IS30 family transposase